jgi:anti-sigma regulatory factor (Ser/Thr protein kinase)
MPDIFRHEALPYGGQADFVPSCVSLLEDGISRERRLILLAAERRLDDVRDALGDRADEVTFVATDEHGRNPARITTMLDSFQAGASGRRSLGITDWSGSGRSPAAFAETQLAESLLNIVTLQSWPLDLVCLYDTTTLEPTALSDVRRAHPFIRGLDSNADYQPELAATLFAGPLFAGPDDAEALEGGQAQLSRMRALVRRFALEHGLTPERAEDLVLAANEIVTNSVRHGGGRCRLALWEQDFSVVCEVVDTGHITDPLAGRLAPRPTATSGRGLWLANHLCDLVQLRSSPAGTVVRLYVDRL